MIKIKPCPVAKKCSGCQLSNLEYMQQLGYKQNKVKKFIGKFVTPENIIGMDSPYHYRNKAQAVFKLNREKKLVTGIFQSKTGGMIECDSCFLQTENANNIFKTLCKLFKSFKVLPFDNRSGKGFIRSVIIREGFKTKETMVVIIGNSPVFPAKKSFVSALIKEHSDIKTIVLSVNHNDDKLMVGENLRPIYGDGNITDILCGLKFIISAKSFYQINPLQTEVLYSKAIKLAALTKDMTVMDAYCGIGTIGLIAAQYCKEVIGFEIVKDAVYDAINNAKLNKIKNARFYTADAKDIITEIIDDKVNIDVAFLDPPRAGCSQSFTESLLNLQPKKIIYISCNPETQAKDLKLLSNGGYKAISSHPFDLFPHTNHLENIVLLTRG